MRLALLAHQQNIRIEAAASLPPRDRTTRSLKAVNYCTDEWNRAYELAKSKGLPANKAVRMAAMAYKLAMPKMESLPAIHAAIAAIAHGITLEVFDGRDASQLLYAAQVAMTVLKQKGAKK